MKKIFLLHIFISLFLIHGNAQNCRALPSDFQSYTEAVKYVKRSNLLTKETINTSNSSWIRAASFYSCDGRKGFRAAEGNLLQSTG